MRSELLRQKKHEPNPGRLNELGRALAELDEIRNLFPLEGWQLVMRRLREQESEVLDGLGTPGTHDVQTDAALRGRLTQIRWLLGMAEEVRKERDTLLKAIRLEEDPQGEGRTT